MNPIVTILVAGLFEIPVHVCTLPNPVGEPCAAKVSDYRDHIRWHKIRDNGMKVIRYCKAGQHEYSSPKNLERANCPKCMHQAKHGPERGKRMLSSGVEKKEAIKAA